jgi:hypothetical protein
MKIAVGPYLFRRMARTVRAVEPQRTGNDVISKLGRESR